jgi:hypothetical protein
MRGHMLEVELLTLDPKSFDNIQDFFTKFKDLLSQLKACRVDKSKEEKQIVLTILSKLGPEFSCIRIHIPYYQIRLWSHLEDAFS